MWWLSGPQDLHRIEDRVSTVYVERCHVDRDDNAVVAVNKDRVVRIPAAMVASLLLGPGTRVTHGAMRLLADSGTAVCWVGDRGVRMYAAGLGTSRGTQLLLRQAYLVTRTQERLGVARRMYGMRFPDDDVSQATMQQLRGREGARVKKLYREHAVRTGVAWHGRQYVAGDAFAKGDDVNRLLSAGHACLYGICHAAIVGVGASPALGFVHTGSATSFVQDIADLYKADYTIPLAFDLAAAGLTTERDARTAFRDQVARGHLMAQVVQDVKALLLASENVNDDTDALHLWDEQAGAVPAGVDWSVWDQPVDSIVGITGPAVPETNW